MIRVVLVVFILLGMMLFAIGCSTAADVFNADLAAQGDGSGGGNCGLGGGKCDQAL